MLCPLGQLSSLLPLRCRSSRVIHSIGDRCHKEKTKTKKNKETRLVMRAGPERKKERRLLGSLSLSVHAKGPDAGVLILGVHQF